MPLSLWTGHDCGPLITRLRCSKLVCVAYVWIVWGEDRVHSPARAFDVVVGLFFAPRIRGQDPTQQFPFFVLLSSRSPNGGSSSMQLGFMLRVTLSIKFLSSILGKYDDDRRTLRPLGIVLSGLLSFLIY